MTTVIVSGGFDPIHRGHVQLIEAARAMGDRLWVILNNDYWLMAKKGYFFMGQAERKAILKAMRAVDRVIITDHRPSPDDMTICADLARIKLTVQDSMIFANGGDRDRSATRYSASFQECELCEQSGITMVFNVGGDKVQSSSALVNRFRFRDA